MWSRSRSAVATSTPAYLDTELRFHVSTEVPRLGPPLGTPAVDVIVRPLTLSSGDYRPPVFIHSGMEILDRTAGVTP